MKILMINKFLYPKGGAETYMLKLGAYFSENGHQVQYFGMDHASRTVGNNKNAYVEEIDFHNSSRWTQLSYPFKIIYSVQARRQLRKVLDDFSPDVCHLNNFHYQLSPSIILEIRKWERQTGRKCRIIYTAHDPQLVCPNHMCLNPNTHKICEKCVHGSFWNCAKNKCIHGSFLRSILGSAESSLWHGLKVYRQIDTIICCSHFIKNLLDTNPILAPKTVALHNFVEPVEYVSAEKKDYVLYFGRYSQEKGIATLVQAAKQLPEIPFVFAGAGPLEPIFDDVPNIQNVGFQNGESLNKLIKEAKLIVVPSECYENCPFSVLESLSMGMPVLGANIGGIPELIHGTGELFESGNSEELTYKLRKLWEDRARLAEYSARCDISQFDSLSAYAEKLVAHYRQ